MKALSVKQPWAGNIAIGRKTAEMRSRRIEPQGDILICAAQQPFKEIGRYQCNNNELWQYGNDSMCDYYGRAIAVVNWYDTVIFTESLCEAACFDPAMYPFGFFPHILPLGEPYIGQWAWMFKDVRLIKPFLVKGQQGLFEINDSLIHYL